VYTIYSRASLPVTQPTASKAQRTEGSSKHWSRPGEIACWLTNWLLTHSFIQDVSMQSSLSQMNTLKPSWIFR